VTAPIVHLPATTVETLVAVIDDAVDDLAPHEAAAVDLAFAAMSVAGYVTHTERFLAERKLRAAGVGC
jgi:hypothetical protein